MLTLLGSSHQPSPSNSACDSALNVRIFWTSWIPRPFNAVVSSRGNPKYVSKISHKAAEVTFYQWNIHQSHTLHTLPSNPIQEILRRFRGGFDLPALLENWCFEGLYGSLVWRCSANTHRVLVDWLAWLLCRTFQSICNGIRPSLVPRHPHRISVFFSLNRLMNWVPLPPSCKLYHLEVPSLYLKPSPQ